MRPKLVAVVVGPTTLAVLLAVISAASSWSSLGGYQQSVALLRLDTQVDNLAGALQQERDLTIAFVASNRTSGAGPMRAARVSTDQAVSTYRAAASGIDMSSSPALRTTLNSVDDAMQGLAYVRNAVDSAGLTLGAIAGTYSDTVGTLSDLTTFAATQDARVARDIRVLGDFFALTEYTSQIRGDLAGIVTAGGFDVGQLQDFINLLEQQQVALSSFRVDSTEAERTVYSNTVQGQPISQVQTIEDNSIQEATATRLSADPVNWFTVSSQKLGLLRQVQSRLLAGASADVVALDDSATSAFIFAIVILLSAVLISVLMSIVVARSISTQLKQLLVAATHVARSWLPEVMRRLRRVTVDPFAEFQIDRVGIISRGEIGDVANAFDSVASACLQLAREQNELRLSINTAFINLALRNQSCVHRMLQALDRWEKDEMDSESLQRLFLLDHLATRMRRTDDSLLVLAGAQAGHHRNVPSPLDEVVSAALSEIEQYARVNRMPAGSVMVNGHAVIDVVHLLAELFDNATRFSAPSTKVELSFDVSRPETHGVVVTIRDHGHGMTPEQFEAANALMFSSVEDIVSSSMRTMGHLVVARLAARHDIRVRLRPAPDSGVIVTVRLPREILVLRPDALQSSGPNRSSVSNRSPDVGTTRGMLPAPGGRPASQPQRRVSGQPDRAAQFWNSDGSPVLSSRVFTLRECLLIRRRWREIPEE